MNDITFEKGETVRLKSGGPLMTVEGYVWDPIKSVHNKDKVHCTWFDKDELKRDIFSSAALDLDEDE